MPMTAMIRNLATMTRVGLLAPMSERTNDVVTRLADENALRRARVHPIQVLAALLTYASGQGARGHNTWTPVRKIVDALDAAFYLTFQNIEPAGRRTMLALDVSGSMSLGVVAGVPGLTPRVASAALSLMTVATEPLTVTVGFSQGITPLAISPRQRLDDVVRTVSNLPFFGTDCAQPMLYALKENLEIDTFIVYTDSETWAGEIHPVQALRQYRARTGIAAKLIVVGMISNGFSIADPDDGGMLDVVGFDTATPALIADFARSV
jgi:60 kDa SS-A/Ro ribonucleoprotein